MSNNDMQKTKLKEPKQKKTKLKKAKQKKPYSKLRKLLLAAEILFTVFIVSILVVLYVPTVKAAVVKAVTGSQIGRSIISYFGQQSYDDSVYDADFDETLIKTNDNLNTKYTSEEYTNFVIFGIDSRTSQFDDSTLSDSILIVSMNNNTGEVNICSVYRDTFLEIQHNDGSTTYNKVNAAYSSGGAVAALSTLNTNLDLEITDYVVVNFAGVEKIIDELGGIEVNLTDGEVAQINKHMKSTILNTGSAYSPVSSSGENITLNGTQAVTYCRIRKTTFYDPDTGEAINDDYGRAARQRLVVAKLVEKAKKIGVSEIINIMELILDSNTEDSKIISTSFTLDELLEMVPVVFNFELSGSEGFPFDLTTKTINGGSYVIPADLESNVVSLHKYLYDDDDYQPTSTVSEISSYISSYTGIYASSSSTDDSDSSESDSGDSDSDETDSETVADTYTGDYDYDDGGISDLY